jgi:hypothetical protein
VFQDLDATTTTGGTLTHNNPEKPPAPARFLAFFCRAPHIRCHSLAPLSSTGEHLHRSDRSVHGTNVSHVTD